MSAIWIGTVDSFNPNYSNLGFNLKAVEGCFILSF